MPFRPAYFRNVRENVEDISRPGPFVRFCAGELRRCACEVCIDVLKLTQEQFTQLLKLKTLRDAGLLTESEFVERKNTLIDSFLGYTVRRLN